jgi:hypothetical protein
MADTELIQLRRDKWRLNGNAVRTLEDARSFIESVGFCLMLPLPAPRTSLVPTFVGACLGTDEKLPTQRNAFTDPRARFGVSLFLHVGRGAQSQASPETRPQVAIFGVGLRHLSDHSA